jgi:hypothetical protein
MSSRRSWRLLLGIWGTYWALLAAFVAVPLALAVRRATSADPGQGNVSVNLGNTGFTLAVTLKGETIYTSSLHLITSLLWIAGPPLLAWLAIALATRRTARPDAVST